MLSVVWSIILLVMTTLASDVSLNEDPDYDYDAYLNEIPDISRLPYIANEEYIRKIHSLSRSLDNYQGEKDERTVIETNALINTKYRLWKRNADLINSLLALPKGMNDAGRR